jgi:hypothetical protein
MIGAPAPICLQRLINLLSSTLIIFQIVHWKANRQYWHTTAIHTCQDLLINLKFITNVKITNGIYDFLKSIEAQWHSVHSSNRKSESFKRQVASSNYKKQTFEHGQHTSLLPSECDRIPGGTTHAATSAMEGATIRWICSRSRIYLPGHRCPTSALEH